MIVLDASALVDSLTNSQYGSGVDWHLERAGVVSAPDLIHVETASALWRMVRAGELEDDEAAAAIDRAGRFRVSIFPHRGLIDGAWHFRDHVRISDAFYLACARQLGVPLLTTDARLARGHHGVSVTLVS